MANATIVQLGGSDMGITASSFDQEFSEARGRGRARRQARRMDRIKKRDERRKARQSARQGRRAERQKRRAEMRDARRTRRQDSKMRRVEARQQRKQRRAEGRQDRKDMRAQRELDREAAAMEQQEMMDERYGDEGGYEEEGGYDEGGYDEGGYDDGGSYASEEGGYEDEGGYEEGGYEDEGGYDEGYEFDGDGFSFADGDDYDSDFDGDGFSFADGDDDDDSEFDGDSYEFFDDNEGETPFDFADGSGAKTPPIVQDVANRIEWNKELVCRLRDKAASGQIPQATAQAEIAKGVARVNELTSCLDAWSNMEGDFVSDATGATKFVATAKPNTKNRLANKFKRKQRIASLKAALQKAKNQRKRIGAKRKLSAWQRKRLSKLPLAQRIKEMQRLGVKPKAVSPQSIAQMAAVSPKAAAAVAAAAAPKVAATPIAAAAPMAAAPTMVSASLSPKFGGQKIIIPAQVSGADGSTGIIALDGANDFDNNYTEVKLGANGDKSGSTTKIPMKPIWIGLGVGAVLAIGYMIFKKK